MTILIEDEDEHMNGFDYVPLLEQAVCCTLKNEACPFEAEVSIAIVDDKEIQKLNQEYRNKDSATDVLSFPMHAYVVPSAFHELSKNAGDFNPDTGEMLLGDIIISYEHVIHQAEEYGHSLKRELAFLTVHSILHLIGYDHMTEKERETMEQKQKEIMDTLGITREESNMEDSQ